jgi:methyltransferase (TIGR00027 family)
VIRRRLDYAASLTAHFNAAERAAESLQPACRRLLNDSESRFFAGPYAPVLTIPVVARVGLRLLDVYLPGLHAHIALRVRYTDDVLKRAVAAGIEQIVLLGAGFDTTSLRRPTTESPVTIFEVDAPTTQQAKRRLIQHARRRLDSQVRWVSCDFERGQLAARLEQAGFDSTRRCVVVWIGVTFYLTRSAIDHTLADVATVCAPGSLLLVDYGDPEIVTGKHHLPGARRVTRAVQRRGEPYRTGLTPSELSTTLATKGFQVIEQLRVPELAQRYAPDGRAWCSTDDWLGVSLAERLPDSD